MHSSPEGWSEASVRELIVHHGSGPSPTCEEREKRGHEWGLLKTTAVTWEAGWKSTAHKVPPRAYWGDGALEVRPGDVVVTKAGPRHRVGVVAHVDSTPPRLMVSGKMILLRPDPTKADGRVLAQLLATASAQKHLDSRTTGMAESQVNFANAALLDLRLAVPPMPEQRRIAETLETLDDAIAATKRLIVKTGQLRVALLDHLVGRTFQDRAARWEPLGRTLGLVIDFRGRTPRKLGMEWGGGDIPALSANNVQMGYINFDRECYLGSDALYRRWMTSGDVQQGDVLVTMEAPLGNVAVVPDERRYILSQRVVLLRFDSKVLTNSYAKLLMSCRPMQAEMRRRSTGTTAVGIRRAELERIEVPVVSREEQLRVANTLHAVEAVLESDNSSLRKLRALRAAVADDLLTGRVRTLSA